MSHNSIGYKPPVSAFFLSFSFLCHFCHSQPWAEAKALACSTKSRISVFKLTDTITFCPAISVRFFFRMLPIWVVLFFSFFHSQGEVVRLSKSSVSRVLVVSMLRSDCRLTTSTTIRLYRDFLSCREDRSMTLATAEMAWSLITRLLVDWAICSEFSMSICAIFENKARISNPS